MIKMINRSTGTIMWVADNRAEKYLAAGHKLAAVEAEKPAVEPEKKKRGK